MSDQALAVLDRNNLQFNFAQAAEVLKEDALSKSALIGKVTNAEALKEATGAFTELTGLVSLIEKARVSAKQPFLDFGREIDTKAKAFVSELEAEKRRLSGVIGEFQAAEEARIRAAQLAEQSRLLEIERQKNAELAKAKTLEEMDEIHAKHNEAAANAPLVAPAATVKGLKANHGWDITVTDLWALARAHPACVKLEPLLSQIKSLLDAGIKVPGVIAKRTVTASAPGRRETPALDV